MKDEKQGTSLTWMRPLALYRQALIRKLLHPKSEIQNQAPVPSTLHPIPHYTLLTR